MPSTVIFKVIFCLESLVAMLQNGFLTIVLVREWVSSTPLVADRIVACLALSRFFLHGAAMLSDLLAFSGFCYQANLVGALWDFINTFLLWLTAWLALFYCVKISSFSHPIFLRLKWRISRLVPRLVLGSLILSSISAIQTVTGNVMAAQLSGGNCTTFKSLDFWYYYLTHGVFMWLLPFLLFLLSTLLLVFSLYRHVGHMRGHRLGRGNPSLQVHRAALKTLAFFLLFNTLYFLALISFAMENISSQSHWYWAKEVIIYSGISLHSLILVVSSPKLRKALKLKC
ncbi:PREDICTED: taste receptor type 2 member 143 [Dipodomys ordii]|uniref:Taste receptor type 2 n=1 Tax=Dipodomys ordii TaxID=10020 RepID=A0A1S3FKG8_DIPOR|nr:PREDICTED: taste receptor type 2 member 143 [Dipodomys ordii]